MNEINNELYEKLIRLQWLLHRNHMRACLEHGPLADPTRGQGRVLSMLKLQPQISTKDLSYLLGIRQQSLSELLNKLEKSDYITRAPSPQDRRITLVELTEKGETTQQEPTDFSSVFDCLSEDEQSSFSDYLDRVIAALETQLGVEPADDVFDFLAAARDQLGDKFDQIAASMRDGGNPLPHFGPDSGKSGPMLLGFRPPVFDFDRGERSSAQPDMPQERDQSKE